MLGQLGEKLSFMDFRSDPFQFRDTLFGANLGDVIASASPVIAREGNMLPLQTHGWPINHKFAQPAAEKIHTMGLRIFRLSIHLFHKEFDKPTVSQETSDLYSDRFARAINLLLPKRIAFRYDNYNRTLFNRSLGATSRFYQKYVQPRLLPELASDYSIWENEGWPHLFSEENVTLELAQKCFQGYLYEKEHLTENIASNFVRGNRKESALVFYPDGFYSLFKSNGENSFTHLLGKLL